MRILICDDQPDVATALRLLLKGAGHQTEEFYAPNQLLDRLGATPSADLILMDMNYARDTTSGEEGLSLLTRIKAAHAGIPVIVMTAWSSVDLAVEAMQRGAVDFIQKPWENSRVIAVVEKQSSHRRQAARNEMEIARNVQQRLFPDPLVRRNRGVEFGGICVPAQEIGGDYYDFLELDGGAMGFVLADVSGKGIPAALLMANLQGSFRSQSSADPRAVMSHVNSLFYRSTPPEHFATAFLGVYDSKRQWLRFANCGHPPGLLLRQNGDVEKLEPTACVLGVADGLESDESGVPLNEGDLVVLYSDGITEAGIESGPEFGESRLAQLLTERRKSDVGDLLATIAKAAGDYAKGDHMDDMTLVGVRILTPA
ncbi:MAG TPA: SpoIIE family protein phosphatase [Bryobacteraceae bacterium]|jgi:sigma-B regulation protein RsbU (phosphoserine phosphatase)